MLKITNVSKKYGDFTALNNLSLTLPNTGLVALTGENGCGKTTLLNLLATIDYDYSGEIEFSGLKYNKKNYNILRNRVVSYIQQDCRFVDFLSISDNIRLSGADESGVDEYFSKYGIAEKKSSQPDELSGGQRQKCSFIRGAIKSSEVLLVDEPTSNMDKEGERKAFQFLQEISKNKLVVMVSHNINLIEEFADLIIRMECGQITAAVENDTESGVRVSDGEVYVSDKNSEAFLHEWIKIKEILFEQKKVVLNLFHRDENTGRKLDYSIKESALTPNKRDYRQITRTTVKELRGHCWGYMVAYILSAIMLIGLAFVVSLKKIDLTGFEADTFKKSGLEFLYFDREALVVSAVTGMKSFTYEDYRRLSGQTDFKSTTSLKLNGLLLPYKYSNVYGSEIKGITYVNDASFFDLICGQKPSGSQIMLTDFLADYVIAQTDATSYEDIIENGLVFSEYHFDVSGIIRTGYKSFLESQTMAELKETKDYAAWRYYLEKQYMNLFTDIGAYPKEVDSKLPFVFISGNNIVADVVFDEEKREKTYEIPVSVNRKLADSLEENTIIKLNYNYVEVVNVVDDDNENPTIYMGRDYKEEFIGASNSIESLELYSVNKETLGGIHGYYLFQDYPLGKVVNEVEQAVYVINQYYVQFLVFVIAVALIIGIIAWTTVEGKRKYVVYTYRMSGYSKGQVFLAYLIKFGVMCAIQLVLMYSLYAGAAAIVNGILSGIHGCRITVMQFDFFRILPAYGFFALLMFAFVCLCFVKHTNEAPVKQYRK